MLIPFILSHLSPTLFPQNNFYSLDLLHNPHASFCVHEDQATALIFFSIWYYPWKDLQQVGGLKYTVVKVTGHMDTTTAWISE